MVNESKPVDLTQVQQFAAAGHFRAIALWVNKPLVPQGIYAQVQADRKPGCLRILVEFQRPPRKEALIQLICQRLWKLDSPVIEGLHLIARPIGQSRPLWERRVKILTPLQRQQKRQQKQRQKAAAQAQQKPSQLSPVASASDQSQTQAGATANKPISPVIRPNDRMLALAKLDIQDPIGSNLRAQRRRRALRRSRRSTLSFNLEQHFKLIRAAVLTGSVAAAFILGCLTEVMISGNGPSLPQWSTPTKLDAERDLKADPAATEVAFREGVEGSQNFSGNQVEAALEPVAVMPYHQVPDPANPTVTLLFGGEVTVGDLEQGTPDDADKVLSHFPAYQQADVAMVQLGNSLATAGTSIQENYYHRTRPEAVAALKEGGIDIVSLTSDRTMKYGVQGLTETLETLDQEGIFRIGAGRDPREARRPEILDVKGQRIAYLGYIPDSSKTTTTQKADVNVASKETIVEDITAIRNEVDWVVVNYRWLGELNAQPESEQVEFSRAAIDAGADLVVGYHPHQLQGAELYKDRPIVYSLGDFIFQDAPLDDHDTVALKVSLRQDKMKVEFLPVTVREAKPQAAVGQQGEAILQQLRETSKTLSSPLNFPVILDTPKKFVAEESESTPGSDSNKLTAPIKSLGELEPGQSPDGTQPSADVDHSGYGTTGIGAGMTNGGAGYDGFGGESFGDGQSRYGDSMNEDSGYYGDSGYEDSGYGDSGYGDSGYAGDSGYEAPGYGDSGYYSDSGYEDSGYGDSGYGDSGYYGDSGNGDSSYGDSGYYGDSGDEDSSYGDSGYYGDSGDEGLGTEDSSYGDSGYDSVSPESSDSSVPPQEDTWPKTSSPDPALTAPEGNRGFIEEAPAEAIPEETESTSDLEQDESYQDLIESWGPKSSPHREFSPIPNHQPPSGNETSNFQNPSRSESVVVEPINFEPSLAPDMTEGLDTFDTGESDQEVNLPEATDAIKPYGEPLVGPLSVHPNSKNDKVNPLVAVTLNPVRKSVSQVDTTSSVSTGSQTISLPNTQSQRD